MNKKHLIWLPVILFMVLIFYLSHQPATTSSELSTGITEVIIQAIEKIIPDMDFDMENLNHTVRKNAHFFAYLFLGVLVINACRKSGIKGFLYAFIISVLYAMSDEFHQLFVPGRAGQVKDIIIDSAGAATGILGYLVVSLNKSRVKRIQKN